MNELKHLIGDLSVYHLLISILAIVYIGKSLLYVYKNATWFHDEFQKRDDLIQSIENLTSEVREIKKDLIIITDESRDYRRTSLHDKITKAYLQYKKQGYITPSQLSNFQLCLQKYYAVGGNGIVKSKIEAEVFDLEIREEQ